MEIHRYTVRCQITYDAADEVSIFCLRLTTAGRLFGEQSVILM